jgi:tetratricopeptide (TPR) repeat protein
VTRRLAAALAAALLAGAPAARAGADDVADAKARLREGAALYRAGRFRDAIAEFEAAYRLRPHGAIHFNVAQCRERLGEWPGALRAWNDYLREVPDAKDRAAVRASIGRIEERLAAAGVQALLVYSDPPGAEVRVDGKVRGATPLHLVLSPGTYALSLSREGYAPAVEDVTLPATPSRAVEVVLRPASPAAVAAAPPAEPGRAAPPAPPADAARAAAPAAPAAPDLAARPARESAASVLAEGAVAERPRERRRLYTWIAAGTAVAAAAAGAYYGIEARRDEEAIDGISGDGALAERTARDAESKAHRANVLYAVAGGATAAGVTLFLVEKRF